MARGEARMNGVERVEGRCGGRPVMEGTRIETRIILGWFMGGSSVADILAMYPHLTALQIEQAIRYEACATCKCKECRWARELAKP